jgi:hypothetical protein
MRRWLCMRWHSDRIVEEKKAACRGFPGVSASDNHD